MSTSLFMKVVPFDLNAGLARVDTRILNLHTRAPRIGGERCLPKSISSGDTSPRVLTWRSRILYCLSSMEVGTQMEMKGSRHFIALCPSVSHKLTGFWFQHHRTFWQLLKSITNCLLLSCAVCSHCGLNVVRTMQIPTRVWVDVSCMCDPWPLTVAGSPLTSPCGVMRTLGRLFWKKI